MKLVSPDFSGGVIQRDGDAAEINLFFEDASPGDKAVTVLFSASGEKLLENSSAAAVDGSVMSTVRIPSGGPYRLETIVSGEKNIIDDFYVGDVWLLAGQSNMAGAGKLSESVPVPDKKVRSFGFCDQWRIASGKIHDISEYKDPVYARNCSLSTADDNFNTLGIGPGVSFGIRMLENTGIPQGLIVAAVGGSSLQEWDPGIKTGGAEGSYYGAMLERLHSSGNCRACGVFWYHGESESHKERFEKYSDGTLAIFDAMHKDMGVDFFVISQIGRCAIEHDDKKNIFWSSIREQQRNLPAKLKNSAVISTLDLDIGDSIHLTSSAAHICGCRAADAALALMKNSAEKMPPELDSIIRSHDDEIMAEVLKVKFKNLAGGVLRSAGRPSGFLMFKDDKPVNIISYVELCGDTALLHLNRGIRSSAAGYKLSYGAMCDYYCNITDGENHSIPGFGPVEI